MCYGETKSKEQSITSLNRAGRWGGWASVKTCPESGLQRGEGGSLGTSLSSHLLGGGNNPDKVLRT